MIDIFCFQIDHSHLCKIKMATLTRLVVYDDIPQPYDAGEDASHLPI